MRYLGFPQHRGCCSGMLRRIVANLTNRRFERTERLHVSRS